MYDQRSTTSTSASARIRSTEISLGLIVRVPLGMVDEIDAKLENLLSGRVVYQEISAGKLWISHRPPHGEE